MKLLTDMASIRAYLLNVFLPVRGREAALRRAAQAGAVMRAAIAWALSWYLVVEYRLCFELWAWHGLPLPLLDVRLDFRLERR